jgi:hypothetical protein
MSLYYDLLHRQPQASEVAGWNSALQGGASRGQVVLGFLTSDEYRSDLVRQDYQTFLSRDADPAGLQGWLNVLRQGRLPQDVMAGFVSSNEYYQDQGGTVQGWVNAIYRDLLGRSGDISGFDFWTRTLQNGVPRSTVALIFVHSQEENARLVSAVYQNLLGRAPDESGLQNWVAALNKGYTLAQLNMAIATSAEYLSQQQGIDFPTVGGGTGSTGGNTGTTGNSGGVVSNQPSRFLSKDPRSGSLSVGPNVDVDRETGQQSEVTVAIDPNNPLRIFVASNDNDIFPGSMGAFSTDGGQTWNARVIGTGPQGDGLPFSLGDPWAAWDEFGNLFYSYLTSSTTAGTSLTITVLLSTDGGKTFTTVSKGTPAFDHPEITAGNGIVAVAYSSLPAAAINILLAQVTGLGQVGLFGVEAVPNSNAKNLGDIAIGPSGQIATTFQSTLLATGPGPDKALISVNTNPFVGGKFSSPTIAAFTNVGNNRPITPQPARMVTASLGLAYDRSNGPHRGRLYLVFEDAADTTTSNLNVFVRFSDNDGSTWSQPVQVNDDNVGAVHFLPKIAVDQTTGNLAVAWYDTRNDPGFGPGDRDHKANTDAELFATVSTDGGLTYLPNVQVASGPSNALLIEQSPFGEGNDFGDYTGLAYSHGVFYPGWSDNSTTLAGNPNLPLMDIAVARVTGPGATSSGGGLPPVFVPRPPDAFDPNETSDRAFSFGVLSGGSQTISNLLISRLPNGLVDNNWWRWQAGQNGTFTVAINYKSFDGGDLQLRVFTLNSQGQLIQLGSSRATGVTSQTVSVTVTAGEPLFAWVYGFNHSEASYQMTFSLA